MSNDNTVLLVAGAIVAVLLLGKKPSPGPGGRTVVSGDVQSVQVSQNARMATHKIQKGPADKVVVAATYSVAAKKPDGTFWATWPYKFFIRATKGATALYSDMSPAISLPQLDDQVWSGAGFGFYLDPTKLANGDLVSVTVQVYGANSNPDGSPSSAFGVLATLMHLDAILYVPPTTVVSGNLSAVNVSQDSLIGQLMGQGGRAPGRGPFYAPTPFTRPPIRAQQGVFRPPQEGLISSGKSNPWLYRERAPI